MLSMEAFQALPDEVKEFVVSWATTGTKLGYPRCCIHEFCHRGTQVLTAQPVTVKTYCLEHNGKATGFIACEFCSKRDPIELVTEINARRNPELPPFPEY